MLTSFPYSHSHAHCTLLWPQHLTSFPCSLSRPPHFVMATTSHFPFWFAQGIGFGIDHARECLEYIDGIAIFCTVALVVLVGAFQEAEKERKFMVLALPKLNLQYLYADVC